MTETTLIIALVAGLGALLVAMLALLRGWSGWLALKRDELASRSVPPPGAASPAARIELADLKERVRRLEAIANGVE